MTNERAIELLKRISDSQFDGPHGDERREALSMAVRALFSQQIVNDSQGLVNDCISRKMAIEAFEPEHDTDWYTPQIIEVLEALPPVQPTQTNADSTQSNTLDCISRQAAIEFVDYLLSQPCKGHTGDFVEGMRDGYYRIRSVIKYLPSAQPERKKGQNDQPESAKEYCAECDHIEMCGWYPYEGCEFRSIPQPQRKKGEWITVLGRLGNEVECNQCHSVFWYWMGNYRFCPSCGARMDGESDE